MKTKLILLAVSSTLLFAAPALLAQNSSSANLSTNLGANFSINASTNISTSTSPVTNSPTRKAQGAFAGEQLLLPPALKAKLKLTETQRTDLKPIEDDFAKMSKEYKTANQPRIDAANEANRQAIAAKDKGQIQTARTQLQQVWAGLQHHRVAAVTKIKPLLTPDQLKVLDDPKNQWHKDHADESNDLSAN